MERVAVVGGGQTRFSEHWDRSLRDLATEAGIAALRDAGIDKADVQSLYVGNMSAGRFTGQEHVAALVSDHLGLRNVPAVRCEAACASGAAAFREAYLAVASGDADIALAVGVEKMTDLRTPEVVSSLMAAGDNEWESSIGLTFSGLYALMARAHMHRYGTTEEQLALVSVQNHRNAVGNRYAQFPFEITVEDVLRSPVVADPLRLLDCCPISDGAAAVVLASEKVAKRLNPVWVLACTQATDTVALHDRRSLTEVQSTAVAGKRAYLKSGLGPRDIDVLEVHDCFSINQILSLEGLGFCEQGAGGRFIEQGLTTRDSDIPTNTTGGLKAGGHPVGATGIRQISDLARQLRGTSHNQVSGARTGMALNVGGTGATANVTVLGADK